MEIDKELQSTFCLLGIYGNPEEAALLELLPVCDGQAMAWVPERRKGEMDANESKGQNNIHLRRSYQSLMQG
jgi:hypothetical protein